MTVNEVRQAIEEADNTRHGSRARYLAGLCDLFHRTTVPSKMLTQYSLGMVTLGEAFVPAGASTSSTHPRQKECAADERRVGMALSVERWL